MLLKISSQHTISYIEQISDIESVTNEAKEVQNYKEALLRGFALVKDTKLLLKKHIVEIQAVFRAK